MDCSVQKRIGKDLMKNHEEQRLNWEAVIWGTTGTVIFMILTFLFLMVVYIGFVKYESMNDSVLTWKSAQKMTFAGPRLQTSENADLKKFRAKEEETLNQYAWEDKFQGIVRVPVEKAMALLAEAKNENR
jgi:hypothetical protein